jgi:hypothetical protein
MHVPPVTEPSALDSGHLSHGISSQSDREPCCATCRLLCSPPLVCQAMHAPGSPRPVDSVTIHHAGCPCWRLRAWHDETALTQENTAFVMNNKVPSNRTREPVRCHQSPIVIVSAERERSPSPPCGRERLALLRESSTCVCA